MRKLIVERLREEKRISQFDRARWHELKERLTEIAISTIDAFCLSLLREFPLEADVDPGFELADDTEAPRLVDESLDQALRICRAIARDDDDVALVYAQLGERRLRTGLSSLLDRRLVAPQALRRYLSAGPKDLTAASACAAAAAKLRDELLGVRDGLETFLADGPIGHLQFAMLAADLRTLCGATAGRFESREAQAAFRALLDRLRGYFLTKEGQPRGEKFTGTGFKAEHCASDAAWKRHRASAAALAPRIAGIAAAFRRDLNVVLSRGVWRIFGVTLGQYQRTLDAHALLDFSGVLERAVRLLKGLDEFAESRFRIESRYRHVLVDEFQDTSRAQWDLVAQLVRSWGEGFGAAADALPPSIFIVGDRKQSIYGFRDAEVAVLDEAHAFVAGLRGDGDPRHAISVSFRAAPGILQFVNELFAAVEKAAERPDGFRYEESDTFPTWGPPSGGPISNPAEAGSHVGAAVNLISAESATAAAQKVAAEIARLLGSAIVRDRTTGLHRPAEPADVAILFRSRDTHREFEKAVEAHGIGTYVYKGLGFFDADEIQDAVATIRYLADPSSSLRAAAFLRSRVARVSDGAIARLACEPGLVPALIGGETPRERAFDPGDQRVLAELRGAIPRWLALVDRVTPSELLRVVLAETDYVGELAGSRFRQARENLKKLRAMVRRFENRGYATLARVADHLDQLAVGDESNAAIDARDAVSLMTVHAAKGLEFPIVFVVNMNRGTGNSRAPIRVSAGVNGADPSVAVADYQSEADEDAVAREREETKRLLYVALTRARDRLYLAAAVPNGTFRPTRGSLGEVLPPSLKIRFEEAFASGADVDPLQWPPAAR